MTEPQGAQHVERKIYPVQTDHRGPPRQKKAGVLTPTVTATRFPGGAASQELQVTPAIGSWGDQQH